MTRSKIGPDGEKHAPSCGLIRAAEGAAAIECPHGYDCCPTCVPCTCRGAPREKPAREKYRWTRAEDATLFMQWHVTPLAALAKSLQRSPGSVWARVGQLKLGRWIPRGCLSIRAAMKRSGFTRRVVLLACADAGVQLHAVQGPGYRGPVRLPRQFVDEDEFNAAILAYLERETINGAAVRRDVTESTLRRWLRDAGLIPEAGDRGRQHRVRTVDIERVVAARRKRVA